MPLKLQQSEVGITLNIKVVPNSSRAQIAGMLGDVLKIKVPQPPEVGKANRAVEAFLAEALGVSPSHVMVVGGHSQPRKTIRITGMTAEVIRLRLEPL